MHLGRCGLCGGGCRIGKRKYTRPMETIRLISARLATNAEKELYYDQNINY